MGPVGQTRCHIDFLLHFLYQSVALFAGHFCDTLVLSQTRKLSSKATELTTAMSNTETTSLVGHTLLELGVWSRCEAAVARASLCSCI